MKTTLEGDLQEVETSMSDHEAGTSNGGDPVAAAGLAEIIREMAQNQGTLMHEIVELRNALNKGTPH